MKAFSQGDFDSDNVTGSIHLPAKIDSMGYISICYALVVQSDFDYNFSVALNFTSLLYFQYHTIV